MHITIFVYNCFRSFFKPHCVSLNILDTALASRTLKGNRNPLMFFCVLLCKRKIENNVCYFLSIRTGCSVNSKVPENYSSKNNNNTHIYNKPSVSSLMFRPLQSQLRGKKFKPKILLGEKM